MSYGTYQPLPLSEVLAHAIRCAEGDQNVHKRYYLALDDLRRIQTALATLPEDAGCLDKGPWKIGTGCRDVYSGDFVADVALRISGDFDDDAHRLRYAEWLCNTLNRAAAPATGQEG